MLSLFFVTSTIPKITKLKTPAKQQYNSPKKIVFYSLLKDQNENEYEFLKYVTVSLFLSEK